MLMLLSFSIYSQQVKQLDTVILQGVRADKKTPVSKKLIKKVDIQQTYAGQEMSMILDKTPSITSSSDGGHPQGYTYFRLRGIDQTRINMTLNGFPLNEPEDQGVYFSNIPNFAKNIKSMQIQRGVGTSTNGTSSFGGSINYVSRSGVKEGTSIEAEYGSFNTQRYNFNHETGLLGDRGAIYVNISTYNSQGYKDNSGGKGWLGFAGFTYLGDKSVTKFSMFTGASNNEMSWFAVSEEDIKDDPKTNYNHPDDDDNFMQTMIMLSHKTRYDEHNNSNIGFFYNTLDGDWDLNVGDKLNFRLNSHFYGFITNYNYNKNNTDINVGVSGNGYYRDHSMVILPDGQTDIYSNRGRKNELSGYFKYKYDINKLTLFGDAQVRYVDFNYRGDTPLEVQEWLFFNPKVGATYNFSDNFNVYGSVGKAHREPTRSDMFGGEDNLVEFIDVTPEEVLDYELGVNLQSGDVTLQANLYYMDFDNEITLLGSLGSYSLQNFGNVEQSYRSGIEIDAKVEVTKGLTFNYNANFSKNKISDQGVEFEPLYTPTVVNNVSVKYQKGNSFIEYQMKNHSESYLDFANENITPSFTVSNISMGAEVYKNIIVKLKVNNVFNAEYFTNGYMDGGVRHFYVNAPLSAYFSTTFKL
jgi:iron complex outermembrane receptor protein